MDSMSLFTKEGEKVVYTGEGGWEYDKIYADKYLIVGEEYIVLAVEIGSSCSEVILEGFEDREFNTVMFKNIDNSFNDVKRKAVVLRNFKPQTIEEGYVNYILTVGKEYIVKEEMPVFKNGYGVIDVYKLEGFEDLMFEHSYFEDVDKKHTTISRDME